MSVVVTMIRNSKFRDDLKHFFCKLGKSLHIIQVKFIDFFLFKLIQIYNFFLEKEIKNANKS